MDYTQLGRDIFKLSKTIRFVEIYHKERKYHQFREDAVPLLNDEETSQSIDNALQRWKGRMSLANKLGQPKYAMAEYEKIKRITIPFNQDGLILVSMDCDNFHEVIVKEIVEIAQFYLE